MTMETGARGAMNDAAITAIDQFIAGKAINKSQTNWKTRLPKPPMLTFDKAKKYYWEMDTNHGAIRIELFPSVAPMHVSSTIYLCRLGFYDGLAFHRVIPGFMAQGGCPMGRGTGGPGYEYDGEFDPKVKHDRPGLLSMANRGPGTDGSQFFITFVPTPHLNGKHTIFGEVMAGAKTVRELEKRGSAGGQPSETLKINKAWISVE
jgi:cyclophilin family peptidyl-prolyl cis-trans isomerase